MMRIEVTINRDQVAVVHVTNRVEESSADPFQDHYDVEWDVQPRKGSTVLSHHSGMTVLHDPRKGVTDLVVQVMSAINNEINKRPPAGDHLELER
jgi:hypothetical protein